MKQKTVLFVSIAVGLLAAILTRSYLATKNVEISRLKAQFVKEHGTMEVVCFKKDVPGGTTLSLNEIGHTTVPAKGLRGQAIPAEMYKSVAGRKTIFGHKRGETVFWSDLEGGNPALRTLAGDVKRQMRAVSINASGAAAVSGMVHPADHVDVIGTFDEVRHLHHSPERAGAGHRTRNGQVDRDERRWRKLQHRDAGSLAARGRDARVRRADARAPVAHVAQSERHVLRTRIARGGLREDTGRNRRTEQQASVGHQIGGFAHGF